MMEQRLIDANKLPITHGLFTPLGGNVYVEYDAVMLQDIKDAPTVETGSVWESVKPIVQKTSTGEPHPNNTWYYCGECRRRLAFEDNFCRECGVRINWDGITRGA